MVVMVVLVVRCLVVTGRRSWNVLAGVHRWVCVQLKSDMISPREGEMKQLTAVCPLDVIAFILLLNFEGLRSRICKYSSVSFFSVSVVTLSST